MWKILATVLIFAAGNVIYFEIQRLIQFLRIYFKESKSLPDHLHSSVSGTAAAHVPK